MVVALATLSTPAQGKGFWGEALVSSFVSSSRISTEGSCQSSSEASSDSSSERKRSPKGRRSAPLRYLTDNYDAIMRDAAAGGGEHLDALARLLGCSNDVRPRLSARAMAFHRRIFAFHRGDGQVDMHATLHELKRVLAEDPNLVDRCSALRRPPRSSAATILTAGVSCTQRRPPLLVRGPVTCHPQPL